MFSTFSTPALRRAHHCTYNTSSRVPSAVRTLSIQSVRGRCVGAGLFLGTTSGPLQLQLPYSRRSIMVSASPMTTTMAAMSERSAKNDLGSLKQTTLGLEEAVRALKNPEEEVKPKIFQEFAIPGGVAVVSGGNGGLGLEMAITLAELGCQVHVIDLPSSPSIDFTTASKYVSRFHNGSALHYSSVDVTSQRSVSDRIESITKTHGRLDACVCAAGILGPPAGVRCTEFPEEAFRKVMDVNANGVFFTAQAAAKGMKETGSKGSIILIASMSGSITNRNNHWVAYNTSKSAVLQMARSMACELGEDAIRVNSISPGHIYTKMTAALLDKDPKQAKAWADANPLGRLGQIHELRGVIAWLASDASTFCTGSDILVSGGQHAW